MEGTWLFRTKTFGLKEEYITKTEMETNTK